MRVSNMGGHQFSVQSENYVWVEKETNQKKIQKFLDT